MEEFIDYAKVIMGTLGRNVFEPVSRPLTSSSVQPMDKTDIHENLLHMERAIKELGETVHADGMQTTEGFVVLKGSYIARTDNDTISDTLKERRRNVQIDENGILLEDVLFSSPSYAAAFVSGRSENGLTRWKTNDGKTLKELDGGDT